MKQFQKGFTIIEMAIVMTIITIICVLGYNAIGSAHAEPVGIAAGAKTGTNWPMAVELANACSTASSPINVVESEGSGLSNIFKIYQDRNTQYGIVQEDALVYQRGIDPKMMDRIVMIFPFFSVEIHIIVKDSSSIQNLADLNGKKVVEGPDGSGTAVTSKVLKQLVKGNWQSISASQSDGMNMVLNGTADAMVIVAGSPIKIVEKTNGIRLIPLDVAAIDNFAYYTKTIIPSGTYPWLQKSVKTYKVNNLIATYAFKTQYQKEITTLVTCIATNVERLQRVGHPKWRDVDPTDIDRIKWQAHPAAVTAIRRVTAHH